MWRVVTALLAAGAAVFLLLYDGKRPVSTRITPTDMVLERNSTDNLPTILSFHRREIIKQNAFIGEIRLGYSFSRDRPGAIVYGATIDAFSGYGPEGQYGSGGYMRLRTTPPGSNVPFNVLVLQQSATDPANYLTLWNAKAGGDVVLQAMTNAKSSSSGMNLVTTKGKVKANGVPLVDQDAYNVLKVRVEQLEAKMSEMMGK